MRVLVTAGGTREPIDSVRYVGNRSSGRMGLALAEEAARRGAEVTLVAANVPLAEPDGVRRVDVETAGELLAAAREEFASGTCSSWRRRWPTSGRRRPRARSPRAAATAFRSSSSRRWTCWAGLAPERRPDQTLVGFAAEHGEGGVERAREKLRRKGLDAVVVNDISRVDIGFDVRHNEVTIITAADERRRARAQERGGGSGARRGGGLEVEWVVGGP